MTLKNKVLMFMTHHVPDNVPYDLYQQFNVNKHIKTYVDYLEVIIRENGVVEYAVPSHQEKLIAIAMKKFGKTRDEISDMCPENRYFDFMSWLCEITDCVSVWNTTFEGKPNQIQTAVLEVLKEKGVYKGPVTISHH